MAIQQRIQCYGWGLEGLTLDGSSHEQCTLLGATGQPGHDGSPGDEQQEWVEGENEGHTEGQRAEPEFLGG